VFTIVLQMLGWLAFMGGTIALGAWLRRNPSKRSAERTSRVMHFLFWLGVVPSVVPGVCYPGLTGFDQELGLRPLPRGPVVLMVGALGLLIGSTYMTLGALLGVIPAHIFYLKYFEEYELELRMGQSYVEYKQRIPFLLPRWFSRKS